jgi:hypothetical protein
MIHDDMICKYDTKAKVKAKLQRKAKLEYNTQSSPPLKRETNSKLPSQASKLGLVKWFGEDICKLVMGVNMNKVNVPFLIVVSQEVKADFYVLVSQSSYHPKQLGATNSNSNILSFYGGLDDARLLARRPRHKRRSKKLTSP